MEDGEPMAITECPDDDCWVYEVYGRHYHLGYLEEHE